MFLLDLNKPTKKHPFPKPLRLINIYPRVTLLLKISTYNQSGNNCNLHYVLVHLSIVHLQYVPLLYIYDIYQVKI